MNKKDKFIKTVQENEKLIYKVASFYTDCKDDRDDLVQEIIYNLWKSFDTFKQQASISTWMYRIAMNVSVFYLKKGKKHINAMPIGSLDFPDTPVDNDNEQLQILRKHIGELNLFDQGILMLYLESKNHEEIAHIVGISKTNVGTKLSRIKEKLRQQIFQ